MSTPCPNCPKDFYAVDMECPRKCLPCPALATTTDDSGLLGIGGCRCPPDYYLDAGNEVCSQCPLPTSKFYCPGNTLPEVDEVLLKGGWYTLDAAENVGTATLSSLYHRCPNPAWCHPPVLTPIDSNEVKVLLGKATDISVLTIPCATGATGLLCGTCRSGYYRTVPLTTLSSCASCPPLWGALTTLLLLLSVLLMVTVFWLLIPPIERTLSLRWVNVEARPLIIPKLRIGIMYCTLFLCIGGLTADFDMTHYYDTEPFQPILLLCRTLFLFSFNVINFSMFSLTDCYGNSSLQYAAHIKMAQAFPFIFWGIITCGCLTLFGFQSSKLPYLVEGIRFREDIKEWRYFLGTRTLCRYIWALTLCYLFTIPSLTRHYAATFPCMNEADLGEVRTFEPWRQCRDYLATDNQKASPPWVDALLLALLSFGIPIIVGLGLFVVRCSQKTRTGPSRLSPRWTLALGILTDYTRGTSLYSLRFLGWHMATMTMLALSVVLSGNWNSVELKCTVFILIVGSMYLIHIAWPSMAIISTAVSTTEDAAGRLDMEPILDKAVKDPIKSLSLAEAARSNDEGWLKQRWRLFGTFLFNLDTSSPNLLNHIFELGLLVNLLAYFGILLAVLVRTWTFSMCVVLLIIGTHSIYLITYLRLLWSEVFPAGVYVRLKEIPRVLQRLCIRLFSFYWDRPAPSPEEAFNFVKPSEINATSSLEFRLYSAMVFLKTEKERGLGVTFQNALWHAALLSPVPAESICQFEALLHHPRIQDATVEELVEYLVEKGHIEPQAVSVIPFAPIIQSLFRDTSQNMNSLEEFVVEVRNALQAVQRRAGIEEQVLLCHKKAACIATKYSILREVQAPKKAAALTDWKRILDVKADANIRTRFLAAQKNMIVIEDANRIRAEFKYIFPDAKPVAQP